ncbi:MAG TPA: GntR family transcriptional regulator [Burkholderiales bacterium]|jgi:DNA-binding GntR family transcriptional regulator|nr:GntR family transcriptional regulator [Burkholderiales bacterium]
MESPKLALIDRPSLHEELVNRLRDLIVEGELPPGTRLNERVLCERFGVSRTPLREAVKVMASEDLVELLPNRGAVVTALTEADMRYLFEVMGALEALAGELACRRIDDAALAEIRALHYQMLLHHTRGELPEYFKCNQQIHEKIVAAAGNPVLVATYRSLSGRIRRARYMANLSQERWDHAVHEHEQILEALTAHDGARLRDLLQRHLANKFEVVRTAIEPAAQQVVAEG